jgi:hypothetical protein
VTEAELSDKQEAQGKAQAWAKRTLEDPDAIVFAVTTQQKPQHLEVVEIAIMTPLGKAKMNQRIRPKQFYAKTYARMTNAVGHAPTFPQVQERIELAFIEASQVVAHDVASARTALKSTAQEWDSEFSPCMQINWVCAMAVDSISRTGTREDCNRLLGPVNALAKCKKTLDLIRAIRERGTQCDLF